MAVVGAVFAPALVVVKAPAAIVLGKLPLAAAVTGCLTTQLLAAGIVPELKLKFKPSNVTVPVVQVVVAAPAVANPEGRASVNVAPVNAIA